MPFIPSFELYKADGTTPQYTFPCVYETNIPQTGIKNTVIEGMRGIGCVVVPGSESSFDITLHGVFLADTYDLITQAIDNMETYIVAGTTYVLKLDKTVSTAYSYNVIRLQSIEYPVSLRLNYQEYIVTFKTNSW